MTVHDFVYACPASSPSWQCPHGAAVVGESRPAFGPPSWRLRCTAGHTVTVSLLPRLRAGVPRTGVRT